jgi:Amt family ammonium transporter
LVAITPSCGFVAPLGAFAIGLAAGVVCSYAVGWKFKAGYDDSLDVVGVHFVGGVVGTFLIGLLAAEAVSGGVEGLFYGGGLALLGKQTVAIPVVALYAFIVSFIIGKVIEATFGFRIEREDEISGIDLAQHAETAYTEGVHGAPQKRPGIG